MEEYRRQDDGETKREKNRKTRKKTQKICFSLTEN